MNNLFKAAHNQTKEKLKSMKKVIFEKLIDEMEERKERKMRVQIEWNPHDGKFWCIEISHRGNNIRCGLKDLENLKDHIKNIQKQLKDEGIT